MSSSCFTSANIFSLQQGTWNCQSVQMLYNVFGSPITNLTHNNPIGQSSNLITLAIGHFNVALLAIVFLIYGYMVFHGVIGSANEGKFGGREMAHWSFPLRALLAPTMLFPLSNGFSMIQYGLMYLILVGVNMANFVWHSTYGDIAAGFVPTTPAALRGAIAQNIGVDFVYASVAKIIENNTQLQSADITSNGKNGKIGIWSTNSFSTLASNYLNTLCSQSIPKVSGEDNATAMVNACQSLVTNMQKNEMANMMSNINQNLLPNQAHGPNVVIGVGSAPNNYDGQVIDPGEITTPSLTDIQSFLRGSGKNGSIMATVMPQMTGMLGASYFGSNSSTISRIDCSSSDVQCDFTPAVNAAEYYVIHNNAQQHQASDTQPNTGNTCAATCRVGENTVYNNQTMDYFAGMPSDPSSFSGKFHLATPTLILHEPIPNINNTQTCKNATGSWTTQCYKQTTTNSPINGVSTQYVAVPAQKVGANWWNASTMYINITKAMAANINKLAGLISSMQPVANGSIIDFASNFGDTAPKMYFTMKYDNNNYDYKTTETGQSPDHAGDLATIAQGSTTLQNSGTTPQPVSAANALQTLPWSSLVNCYDAEIPAVIDSTGNPIPNGTPHGRVRACLNKILLKPTPAASITVGGTATGNNSTLHLKPSGYPSWLKPTLEKVPYQYQAPLKVLMMLNMGVNKSGQVNYITNSNFEQYLLNMINVLDYNHAYPGDALPGVQQTDNTANEITPVNNWINNVFSKIMGTNMIGGGDNIMKRIYALGNNDLTGGNGTTQSKLNTLANQSFDTVAQAQSVGLDMINTVLNALMKTYKNITGQFSSDRKSDFTEAEEISGAAGGAAAIGSAVGASSAGTVAAIVGSLMLQMKMAYQMYDIGKEMMWMPIALLILTSLFTAGIQFAVVLPLTPFILMWAGQVAWLIGVIEAMVAAPLVAISIMLPGGHQHFGHGVGAIKMAIGIIFRPVLMVLGLLVGIVLTFILIRFSSQGFQVISSDIIAFAGSSRNYMPGSGDVSMTQGIIACILLLTFCSFIMMSFTKCYSTIYVLPEKVVQWVGGVADKAGQQEMQQISQGVSQSAQSAGQAGGQTAEKGIGNSQQMNQSMGSIDSSMISGSKDMGGAIGSDASKAAGAASGGSSSESKGVTAD